MSLIVSKPEETHIYKLINENSLFIYQKIDAQGFIKQVSPLWCELLGYSDHELKNRLFCDLVVSCSSVSGQEYLALFKNNPRVANLEFAMRTKNASVIEVRMDSLAEYDKQGRLKFIHCLLLDLTEKKKNIALQKSFKYIFENSLSEIFVFDALSYKFVHVNSGACKNIGYTQQELTRLTPLDIKPDLSLTRLNKLLAPLRSGDKESIQFETTHQRKDGSQYFVQIHIKLTRFLSKPCFVAMLSDISQSKEMENRLNHVIQGAELGYWDWDYSTQKRQVNNRWLEMLGVQQGDEQCVDDWLELLHQDDKDRVLAIIQQGVETKQPYTVEFRMRHRKGHWVWIQEAGAVVSYDANSLKPLRLCGTHQDITSRKQNEMQLKKLSRAVEQSPNLVIITDTDGNIEYVNPKIDEITGYTAAEVIGQNTRIFRSGETLDNDYKALWDTIKSGSDWHGVFHNKKKNGDLYWVQESIAAIRDDNQQITHFIAIQEDISEVRQVSEQLNYQATHDPLTGLVNRREFEIRVEKTLEKARFNQSNHVICYLDLDQFKVINDTCSHVAGDELLKQFAQMVRATFQRKDSIGRLGGDEFAVLLENCSIEQAEKTTQLLLNAVDNYQFSWDGKDFRIGVSAGIVALNQQSSNISTLLSQLDIACYAAKQAGRNCVHVYQECDNDLALSHKKLQWISKVNQALNEDLFILYAQPICQLGSKESEPVHYEVLIRLQDSSGEIIFPDAFLPTVERFNLALQLDQWVIKASFDWLSRHKQQGREVPFLSINLSGQNLGNKKLLAFIHSQVDSNPELTDLICFEITETAAINNLTDARAFISELKELGFQFSLDDFGSGLSSFDYLKNLPVDYLKIDGQFVKNIEQDPIDLALVRSINEIAHLMGKKTIAEFVENEQILLKLSELNVDYVQGYYLGKPLELDSWVRQ